MSNSIAIAASQEIILLAMEIEALDSAEALDPTADDEVMRVVARHGAADATAGLLLTLFVRRGPEISGLLWGRLPRPAREGLIQSMFRIQPHVAARSLGAHNLCDCLALTADPRLHDAVATALATTFVADSDSCLAALLPPARDRLALVLAERAGRETDTIPGWIPQLPEQVRSRAIMAFAFGALLSGRETSFDALTIGFADEAWEVMMAKAQQRGADLASGSIDMLLRKAPASVRRTSPPNLNSSASHTFPTSAQASQERRVATDSERASAIVIAALTADAKVLADLTVKAGQIAGPTWRREAQNAIFRRGLAIGASSMTAGLPRTDIASAIVVQRLERGDTDVLRRRAWAAIRVDRRFTLLMEIMVSMERRSVVPTPARLDDVVTAVLSMAGGMRDVLMLHLVTHLGRLPALADATLDRIAETAEQRKDEIFTALARIYALRGDAAKAQQQMHVARSASQDRLRETAFERLNGLLEGAASVPIEPVEAIVSALATISASDLPAAMQLCFERLPRHEIDFVVAEVISRGRAADAFSGIAF